MDILKKIVDPITPSTSTPTTPLTRITLGTRRSKLARIQADAVAEQLRSLFPTLEIAIHATDPLGDRDKTTALYAMGDKSLWTGELEELLAAGQVDAIVNCVKDMPTGLPKGMMLGAVTEREDPRDAVVLPVAVAGSGSASASGADTGAGASSGASESASTSTSTSTTAPASNPPSTSTTHPTAHSILSALPPNSLIGTSSLRRTAQLKRAYPHLSFDICRGNVPTRLAKLDNPSSFPGTPRFAALILAAAGLHRLALAGRISAYLAGNAEGGSVLYAVGQGAIGIEVREDDARVRAVVAALAHEDSALECWAERALMRALEGGCSVPIGVEARWVDVRVRQLNLRGVVVSLDGGVAVEAEREATLLGQDDAEELGRSVARLLIEKGAGKILDDINAEKKKTQEEARQIIGNPKDFVENQA